MEEEGGGAEKYRSPETSRKEGERRREKEREREKEMAPTTPQTAAMIHMLA